MIGVVFATKKEADPFLKHSNSRLIHDLPFELYSGELNDQSEPVMILISGIGKVAASLAVHFLMQNYDISYLINAGIAGSLEIKGAIKIQSIFKIDEVIEGELKCMDEKVNALPCSTSGWPDLKVTGLVTNDQPVFEDMLKARYAPFGKLVDMEGAAIARTAAQFNTPVTLIKGVSDFADEKGRASLKKNIDEISSKIALILKEGIASIKSQPEEKNPQKSRLTLQKMLRFTKIEHTSFSLPLIFAGAWIGADFSMPSFNTLLLIIIAAIGARVFGMAFNRIFDRKIDALNPRTAIRELPSGIMTVFHAYLIAGAGFLVYLIACIVLGGYCIYLFPIPLIPLLGYSLLKRWTPFCHFGIGLCLSLAPIGAFIAVSQHLNLTLPILLFSLFVFLWMSASDIIYAIMDIESDQRHHVHSLPAKLGKENAQKVASRVHFFSLVILVLMVLTLKGGMAAWVMTGYTAIVISLMYHSQIPVPVRFFPISTLAGISGALIPVLIG